MFIDNKYDMGNVLEVTHEDDVILGRVISIVCYENGAIYYRLCTNYCTTIEVKETNVIDGYFKLNKEL
jgi:hypothetical protein